jgi:hypothetical protein
MADSSTRSQLSADLLASMEPQAALAVVAAEPAKGAELLASLDAKAALAILAVQPVEGARVLAAMKAADALKLLAMDEGRRSEVDWDPPWPYGYPGAVDSAAGVVSPLLGGFSFALIGLIVQDASALRWPGLALALFVIAGLSFIAAVQCGFWAKQWVTTPSEIEEWRPNDTVEETQDDQRIHRHGFKLWARRLRFTYRLGIVTLLAGVTVALVPVTDMNALRKLAVLIAAIGLAAELSWISAGWLLHGSPMALYAGQDDVPKPDTRFRRLRSLRLLRWLARCFEPVVPAD